MGIAGSVLVIILIFIISFRTAMVRKAKVPDIATFSTPEIALEKIAERLSLAIQKQTISYPDLARIDWKPYDEFVRLLADFYPQVHRCAEIEKVNQYGLIYHLKGEQSDQKPVLLTAHYDVVPVEKSTLDQWEHPPFSGSIEGGFVWGRGTMDMKLHLLSLLEALEMHLKEGFKPKQDLYLAFGHDEECRGIYGAGAIAEHFKSKGLEFDFVLDEGGFITEGSVALLDKPLALIGIAEKGFASVRMTVESTGGHSSMPPKQTVVGALARIVADLEKEQFKLRLCAPVKKQFETIGTEFPFYLRLLTANLWLFGPLFARMMSKTSVGNAMMRTTTAATVFEGSQAHNVLAPEATAIVNFRLLPGETVSDVIKHIKKIAGKQKVELEPMMPDEPSLVSPTDCRGYKIVEAVTHKTFPGALVSPYLVLGGTDSRKYEIVCPNIFRLSPIQIHQSDLDRIHNVNERVSFANIENAVLFFYRLLSEI